MKFLKKLALCLVLIPIAVIVIPLFILLSIFVPEDAHNELADW